MPGESLTLGEAAVVAGVSVREVNRVIDEGILPSRFYSTEQGRRLLASACPLVSFYFRSAGALTAAERGRLIDRMGERIRPERRAAKSEEAKDPSFWMVADGFLSVNFSQFVKDVAERRARLDAARRLVVVDPHILAGTPVIRGTRVPVHDVAASVAAGLPRERIRKAYGDLDEETLELAALYAEAFPTRGRPRRTTVTSQLRIVSQKTVPRRRPA